MRTLSLRACRLRHAPTLLATACAAVALAACGSDSSATTSTSSSGGGGTSGANANQQNAAQTKLLDCLRKQGIDLPAPGSGAGLPQNVDRDKLQAAFAGPCKAEQQAATGGQTQADRQGFSDQLAKFASCMRKQGIDVPDPSSSGGVPSGAQPDQSDPKVKAASQACASSLPQGVPGTGAGQ